MSRKGLPSFIEELNGYDYKPEKAKALLAEADIPPGTEVVLSTTSSYLDICEYIQNQLQELGLNIKGKGEPTLYAQADGGYF